MAEISDDLLLKMLDAALSIKVEGTSQHQSGFGPPYKAPWFIIDASSAEPEVNWPGALIEEIHFSDRIRPALKEARAKAMQAVLRAAPKSVSEARLDALRKLCGYVENGSSDVVHISQDDATKDWIISTGELGKPNRPWWHGSSFGEAIDNAAKDTPNDD